MTQTPSNLFEDDGNEIPAEGTLEVTGEEQTHDLLQSIDELDKLSEQLSIKPYQKLNVDNYFLNKKVVITGTLNNFTRDEIKTKLNSLGSKFVSQVSKNVDLVIYGENPGSKLSKAQELNIKMIDEKKLNEILDKL